MDEKKDIHFDKRAAQYDKGVEGKLSRRFYETLVEQVQLEEGAKVLDVGCGTGTILYLLCQKKNIEGHGVDVEEKMLEQARKKLESMDIRKASCIELPYEDQSMDVVTACMAFHHFSDREGFLKEAQRVLKPSGMLYICDPSFPSWMRRLINKILERRHINAKFYGNKALGTFVERNGFNLVRSIKKLYVQVLEFEVCHDEK